MHGYLEVQVGSRGYLKVGTEVCRLVVTREFAHARNFNSKSPPKVSACADLRRKFVTTNLQTSVSGDAGDKQCMGIWRCRWEAVHGYLEVQEASSAWVSGGAGGKQRVSEGAGGKQYMGIWRCRRQAVHGYLEVQEASSALVSRGAGEKQCMGIWKCRWEVQEASSAWKAKKFPVMILSRLFLVPFLVPAFLLSQVPLGINRLLQCHSQ